MHLIKILNKYIYPPNVMIVGKIGYFCFTIFKNDDVRSIQTSDFKTALDDIDKGNIISISELRYTPIT